MAIRIDDDETLGRLLRTLADEVVDAQIYWRLHLDVQVAAATFRREFGQSRAFWSLTQNALQDATVFRLCKIYDQHKDALQLRSLLETIRAERGRFTAEAFRERLKASRYVDHLAKESRVPDEGKLQRDIEYVSEATNPVVATLVGLRNKYYAHRGSREVVDATDFAVEYPLTKSQVSELLDGARKIVNHYSSLYSANTYSAQIVGHDDYKTIIEALHWDLARRDSDTRRQEIRVDLKKAWDEVAQRERGDAEGRKG